MSAIEALEELFASSPGAVFTRRNEAIPGDLRITWRLSLLCLLLQRFRGNTATHEHLHILWWAIRSEDTQRLFIRWFDGDKRPDELIVRFDPSLSVTVDLALGSKLVTLTSTGSIGLTATGVSLANDLWTETEILREEKSFLTKLPRKMTQRSLKELTEWK